MCPIPGKESFICKQRRALLQVSIEVANEVLCLRDVTKVGTEKTAELLGQNALADTFGPAQHNRDFACSLWMLGCFGHPVEKVFGIFFITAADIVLEMGEVEAAVTGATFAAVSAPKVKVAVFCAVRCIDDAVILSSLRVVYPPFTQPDFFDLIFADHNHLFALGVES